MLDTQEQRAVYERGYLPEHLPDYVSAISMAEPFLHENHLCLLHKKHLTFIGYPMDKEAQNPALAYESACRRFKPSTAAIIAAEIWLPPGSYESQPEDRYFLLNLPAGCLPQALNYMVRRGGRDLAVTAGRFGREHKKLIRAFVSYHDIGLKQARIFKRIPGYLRRSHTARLLEARRGDTLVGFNIVDLGSADYAYYLFNFRSPGLNIPGTSDLLFSRCSAWPTSRGKGP